MIKKSTWLVIAMIIINTQLNAQSFSQIRNTMIFNDPSMTGTEEGLAVTALGQLGYYISPKFIQKDFYTSVDFGFRKIPFLSGVGLVYNYDNQMSDFIKNHNISLSIAGNIPFSESCVLQGGIKTTLISRHANWEDFVFGDPNPISPSDPLDNDQVNIFDFGAGLSFRYSGKDGNLVITSGIAADHLFEPNISFLERPQKLYRSYVVHSEMTIITNEQSTAKFKSKGFRDPLKICPSLIITNQEELSHLMIGGSAEKFGFMLGMWYKADYVSSSNEYYSSHPRLQSHAVAQAGYRQYFGERINLALCYSMNLFHKNFSSPYINEISLVFGVK